MAGNADRHLLVVAKAVEACDAVPMPQSPEPDAHGAANIQHDEMPREASRAGGVTRLQARAGGYVARHPAMLRVLAWLGWNNPGGSMNP